MERNDSETQTSQSLGAASIGATHSAYEPIADTGSSLREKAGGFKKTIADALESGAEKLRQQGAASQVSNTTSAEVGGAFAAGAEGRLEQTSNQLAGGMQGAADWLREADLDGRKAGIERQVKEHPARSLAIAVGVGYLLGKAFRRQ
ncbi:MAG: hypothetical protein JWL61_2725 [Gemmatimonadetes bacterium]|nr:hypothetical protein [Gemmatimonadota bacterium]